MLSEGEISDLHVGLKGFISALYLKAPAGKTTRSLRGQVEAGKFGGGNSYGYQVVNALGVKPTIGGKNRRLKLIFP